MFYMEGLFKNLTFSPLLIEQTTSLYDRTKTLRKEFISFMGIVPFFFLIMCFVETCHWCNLSFIRSLRANERTDMRTFFFFLLVYIIAYAPISCLHFQIFHYMKHFNVTMNDTDLKYAYWNKIQVVYECCGIHNYTYWRTIPYSCCVNQTITNCTANISNIYQKGCLLNINTFVNDKVRFQTSDAQLYCLTVGVLLMLIGVTTLYFSRNVYCVEPERRSEGLVNEYEPLIYNENEREGLVGNQPGASYMSINSTPRDNTQVHIKNSSDDTGDDEFFDTF